MNEKPFTASPRGAIPPGKLGLVVLAAALAPIFIRKCKPLVKGVADGLVKAGERLRNSVAEPNEAAEATKATAASAKKSSNASGAEPKTTVKPKRPATKKPTVQSKPAAKPAS